MGPTDYAVRSAWLQVEASSSGVYFVRTTSILTSSVYLLLQA